MKRTLLALASLLTLSLGSQAQQEEPEKSNQTIEKKYADSLYLRFLGQLVSVNGNSSAPAATLELSDQPNIKLNLPLYQGFKYDGDAGGDKVDRFNYWFGRWAFYLDGKAGATNGFSPLISKGSWKPNSEGNFTALLFWPRAVRFYTSEVDTKVGQMADAIIPALAAGARTTFIQAQNNRNAVISEMPISQASSINYGWFSFRAGASHSEYNLYNDGISIPFGSRLNDTLATSGNFRVGYSHYYFPSKSNRYWRPFSFYGTGFLEYKTLDNNYNTLTKVDVERLRGFSGPNDSSMLVTDNKVTAGKGKYIAGSSFTWSTEVNLLISPQDAKTTIGLGAGVSRKFFNQQSYSTATFTLNFPIKRRADGNETAANIAFRAELPDIHSEHQPEGDLDQRARLGFILSVALPNHR